MANEPFPTRPQSNTEIARRLNTLAQMLQAKGENPFKVSAYRKASRTIESQPQSISQLVRDGGDVTQFEGIGKGIAAALREIVFSGKLGQLEMLLTTVPPEVAALQDYPKLDPTRTARVFKKLKLSTVADLKDRLDDGSIKKAFGQSMEEHFRAAFRTNTQLLLDDADKLAAEIGAFLEEKCGADKVAIAGAVRRRVEVVDELVLVIETANFSETCDRIRKFGGGIDEAGRAARHATFQLSNGVPLLIHGAVPANWGTALVAATGSEAHLKELEHVGGLARRASSEQKVYSTVALKWVTPELREGRGETALAATGALPELVTLADIRGDLHMHSTASDGLNSIEEMAEAAKARGYDYIGITDHSQSLRIARGVTVENLWTQIRRIDRINGRGLGIRILKSAEVDILADGSLDYPDDLLAELDYTVCSIHSRFRLGRSEQTERLLRAMDHPAFTILGHATGRLLLKRPGYNFDFERIAAHAKAAGCFFEINADPDRLDLSADNARQVIAAGGKLAINTDAHSTAGLDYMHCGIDVGRRAGAERSSILNALPWTQLRRVLNRR